MPMFRRRPRLRDAAVGGRAHMMGKHREGGQEEEREPAHGEGQQAAAPAARAAGGKSPLTTPHSCRSWASSTSRESRPTKSSQSRKPLLMGIRLLVLGLGGTPYIVAMGALVVFAAAGFVAALLLPAEPRAASARV